MLLQLGVLSALILGAVYLYFRFRFTYWKKRGVPTLDPSFPFGNFGSALYSDLNPVEHVNNMYRKFEGHKVGGLFSLAKPTLLLRDPEVIRDVMVKHFDHFYSRGVEHDIKHVPLQAHLFSLNGPMWRSLRVKMTPTFTSGKMRMMFPTLVQCGQELSKCLEEPARNTNTVEIKELLARYSTDIIASCAFGITCNCLRNPEAEFRQWGKKIFTGSFRSWLFRIFTFLKPSLIYTLKFSFIPTDVSDYFRGMVKETVEYREKNQVQRSDFMQLLIHMKNKTLGVADEDDARAANGAMDNLKGSGSFEVTMDLLAAQAFVFFIAGFETSSATMTFALYELALHQDMQDRVRAEIDSVLDKHGGQVTYDSLLEMEYLDRVVAETLRKYPVLPVITRECTKPVKLAGTDLVVDKGVQILIPVGGLHHDPKYFPDPQVFDPERFSDEEKKKRPHFCYLPFGEGPRLCIGMRFGQMQVKIGIISVLSKFKVHPCAKTPIPIKFDPKTIIPASVGGMWLTVETRD